MQYRSLFILCHQETRIPFSGTRILDNGYVLITAGRDDNQRTYAGVAFLVSPRWRKSIISFKPISERICRLKLRVKGGKLVVINAYATHGGYDYNIRQQYFADFAETIDHTSCYGLKLVVGDLNSRIHNNIGGEGGGRSALFWQDNLQSTAKLGCKSRASFGMLYCAGHVCVANILLKTMSKTRSRPTVFGRIRCRRLHVMGLPSWIWYYVAKMQRRSLAGQANTQ